ncbi:hypothetical protein MJD09_16530, partial [bacterium]|nr:hypothetical protein [bacterium]
DNGGSEVGAVTMTADESFNLYAAGYDAQDIYLGDVSVTWSSASGDLTPAISGSGSSFTFSPSTAPANGVIRATHATAGNDDTGPITVGVGALSYVQVNNGGSGNTSEVSTNTLTTGGTFTVHASGYDADGNYRSDESVSWSVTGAIGNLSTTGGVSTTLTATTPGTGVIQADHATALDDATGTITVNAGAIDHIIVRDAPDNGGNEVGAVTITADETVTLYAAAYDAQDIYLGDVNVTWSLESGTLAPTPSGSGSSFTFNPSAAPASGVIRATHATAGDDDTGQVTVTVGVLSFVRVNSGVTGNTSEVTTNTLSTGSTFAVHASGYDGDGNYRSDESVTWAVTGGIGNLSSSSGVSTTLTATTPGTGVIQADHIVAIDDATGTITVQAGSIDHILVRDAPDNGGVEVQTVSLNADERLVLYAASYDAQDNFLGDVSVTWSLESGTLAPTPSGSGSSFVFSPTTAPTSGIIRATHATAGTDDTGTIDVAVGALSFVRVNNDASGPTAAVTTNTLATGQTFTVHASGYDADGNYRSDESVGWSVTGGIGTLDNSSGISTTLTTTTPGNGVIQADHVTAIDDATGTITVIEGAIDHIIIRNGPSNSGIELGDFTLTADDSITIFAAAYDGQNNYLGETSVTWSASGNLAPVSDSGTEFTFSPTTAPASGRIRASHPTAADDSTGIATVTSGNPVGTVDLTATPNTVSADDTSKARITSSTIFDLDGNPVGSGRLFTVSLSNASLGDIITLDAAPGQTGHQVATTSDSELDFVFESDTLGGSVTIFVSSIGGSAQGNATVSIGALNIISISATPTFVSQGQSGVAIQMVVENTSSSAVTNLGASLTFTGSSAADRTGEYTQNRADGATSIPAQSQITLTFDVTVLASATEESI